MITKKKSSLSITIPTRILPQARQVQAQTRQQSLQAATSGVSKHAVVGKTISVNINAIKPLFLADLMQASKFFKQQQSQTAPYASESTRAESKAKRRLQLASDSESEEQQDVSVDNSVPGQSEVEKFKKKYGIDIEKGEFLSDTPMEWEYVTETNNPEDFTDGSLHLSRPGF